jgi:hypothetical protein
MTSHELLTHPQTRQATQVINPALQHIHCQNLAQTVSLSCRRLLSCNLRYHNRLLYHQRRIRITLYLSSPRLYPTIILPSCESTCFLISLILTPTDHKFVLKLDHTLAWCQAVTRHTCVRKTSNAIAEKFIQDLTNWSNAGNAPEGAITVNEGGNSSRGKTITKDIWPASIQASHIAHDLQCYGDRIYSTSSLCQFAVHDTNHSFPRHNLRP